MNNSRFALYLCGVLIGNCHSDSVPCWQIRLCFVVCKYKTKPANRLTLPACVRGCFFLISSVHRHSSLISSSAVSACIYSWWALWRNMTHGGRILPFGAAQCDITLTCLPFVTEVESLQKVFFFSSLYRRSLQCNCCLCTDCSIFLCVKVYIRLFWSELVQ